MNILFLAAEVAPFVSIGGLSQVMYFLPKALHSMGHDVRIFTAKYGTMDEPEASKKWRLHMEMSQLEVPVDEEAGSEKSIICNIKAYTNAQQKLHAYFLENREYFELRANVFGYGDDHIRFGLLSKGCLEWLKQMKEQHKEESDTEFWWPDIIHVHDWHTSYLVDLARRDPRYAELFRKVPIVMTAHNFAYQGNYDFRYASAEEYDQGKSLLAPFFSHKFQTQNALKRGILYADAVNTVSPTHAVEILTPEYAEGLDDALRKSKGKLTGILNGLDTKSFDPEKDPIIKKNFNAEIFIHARRENKLDLQKTFGLLEDPYRPLLAVSGRLAKQKGIDLLLEVLPHLFMERPDAQVVVLGTGEERYRLELTVLQKKFPEQLGLHLRPDFELPRKIYAGADITLIPSLFEPGGIVALEALRYGCVPIVRRTGGLNDIVIDFQPNIKMGNGFSFQNKDPWSLYGKICEALAIYKYTGLWYMLVQNALVCDFSWNYTAKQYERWYRKVLDEKKTAARENKIDDHLYLSLEDVN